MNEAEEPREDGSAPSGELPAEEQPQVFALRRQGSAWSLSRRDFAAAAGAAAAVTGCSRDKPVTSEPDLGPPQLMLDEDEGEDVEGTETKTPRKAPDPKSIEGRCYRVYAHTGPVRALAVSKDGTMLASGSSDKTIKLWALPDGYLLQTLRGHTGPVNGVLFWDRMLVSEGSDGVRLWRIRDGAALGSCKPPAPVSGVFGTLSRTLDGKHVIVSGGNLTTLVTVPGLELTKTIDHGERLTSSRVSDGKLLVGGNVRGEVKVWRIGDSQLDESKELHGGFVNVVAVSPDGEVMASGGQDQNIRLWSGESFEGHTGSIYSLAFTPDGKTLASGASDRTIRLWAIPGGKSLATLQGHRGTVLALAITPNGRLLISGGGDRSIRLWSLTKQALRGCLIDLTATPKEGKGVQFTRVDPQGRTVTYTLPCGTTIPPGSTCVCNCVSGSYTAPGTATARRTRPKTVTNWGGPTTSETTPGVGKSGTSGGGKGSGSSGGGGGHYWFPN